MPRFFPGDVVRLDTSPEHPSQDWIVIATHNEWVWAHRGGAPVAWPIDFLVLVRRHSQESSSHV